MSSIHVSSEAHVAFGLAMPFGFTHTSVFIRGLFRVSNTWPPIAALLAGVRDAVVKNRILRRIERRGAIGFADAPRHEVPPPRPLQARDSGGAAVFADEGHWRGAEEQRLLNSLETSRQQWFGCRGVSSSSIAFSTTEYTAVANV